MKTLWSRRQLGRAALTFLAAFAGIAARGEPAPDAASNAYRTVFATDWKAGFDPRLGFQSASPADITVVTDPLASTSKAVRISIDRSADFSRVANGSPRTEMVFSRIVRFVPGHDYVIRWSTYIPEDFSFDPDEVEVITQIHHGGWPLGAPPIMLTIAGSDYTFSERGGEHTEHGRGPRICCASSDKGRWVNWMLHYVPDASGHDATTELWKDGAKVFLSKGKPNAYPDDREAYLKLGFYKAGWRLAPSRVERLLLFYGPLSIAVR
jgi:Polysaccharide lyase